jgi:hypothetical protein
MTSARLGGIGGKLRLVDKADVRKAFRLQKLSGDHLRHGADCRSYRQSDGRRLRARLGCFRSERRQHPSDASERCGPEKAASRLQCGTRDLPEAPYPLRPAARANVASVGNRRRLWIGTEYPLIRTARSRCPWSAGPFSRRRDCVGRAGVSPGIRDDHKPVQVRGRAASTFKGGRRTAAVGGFETFAPDLSGGRDPAISGRLAAARLIITAGI